VLLDFPRDGTNNKGDLGIKSWQDGLIAILKTYENPIIVAHSFGAMFCLNMPEIVPLLSGIVLMNATTANSFFVHINLMQQKHKLPDLVPAASEYPLNPSDETYRQFWNVYKYYYFTQEEMTAGECIMRQLAFNHAAYSEAIHHFYPTYTSNWAPATLPIMTIASEYDYICPPGIFVDNEKFHSRNILNKVITQAGHCPWLLYFKEVQSCFDEFIKLKLGTLN
jgi:pimeloyl-ACP methyl ester carboxylesterase